MSPQNLRFCGDDEYVIIMLMKKIILLIFISLSFNNIALAGPEEDLRVAEENFLKASENLGRAKKEARIAEKIFDNLAKKGGSIRQWADALESQRGARQFAKSALSVFNKTQKALKNAERLNKALQLGDEVATEVAGLARTSPTAVPKIGFFPPEVPTGLSLEKYQEFLSRAKEEIKAFSDAIAKLKADPARALGQSGVLEELEKKLAWWQTRVKSAEKAIKFSKITKALSRLLKPLSLLPEETGETAVKSVVYPLATYGFGCMFVRLRYFDLDMQRTLAGQELRDCRNINKNQTIKCQSLQEKYDDIWNKMVFMKASRAYYPCFEYIL